jgi:hypothetical protein
MQAPLVVSPVTDFMRVIATSTWSNRECEHKGREAWKRRDGREYSGVFRNRTSRLSQEQNRNDRNSMNDQSADFSVP